MLGGTFFTRVWRRQSDLSLALFTMFASGGLFALLAVTVVPPVQPIAWYLVAGVSGFAFVVALAALIIGRRLTVRAGAVISSIYLVMLVFMVFRASNLSRATVAGMLLVVVFVLSAWFMPMWYSRTVGYTALGLIGIIIIARFPGNDAVLTVVALVSLSVLLTEVFGRFRRNLQRVSLVDHLTGAWNRAGFERLLESHTRSHARTGEPLTAIYLDLDEFKAVNDQRGHAGGDEVLREVTSALTQGVRASDSVARIGGDEFVLLLPRTSDAEAKRLCERLRADVVVCGWSYGVSQYRAGEPMYDFIDRADAEAMQMKRAHGRGR